jgi:hypothetical protein
MLGLVVAVLLAGSGTGPREWLCEDFQAGGKGEQVRIRLVVEADGKVSQSSAAWIPPMVVATPEDDRVRRPAPLLLISYRQPTEAGIGPPADVDVLAIPRSAIPQLNGSQVTVEVDHESRWTVVLAPAGNDAPEDPSASRFAAMTDGRLLAALETAREGEATLTGNDGRVLGQVRYDLAARAERDSLYRRLRAWIEDSARRPAERCQAADSHGA